jgi:hypothetical protein
MAPRLVATTGANDGNIGIVDLDLLGIVVFVLDPDVTGLILVCILIFEVVT